MSENLIEALQSSARESREFAASLDETARHLGGDSAADDTGLAISKGVHLALAERVEAAIASGDVVQMVQVATALGIAEPAAPAGGGTP